MRCFRTLISAAALTAILALAPAGCQSGFVQVGAAGDGAYYDYTYYPDSEVYYYPSGSVYYWRDHDRWEHGRELPRNFDVRRENSVALHMKDAHPWENHAQIRAEHPGHHEANERH